MIDLFIKLDLIVLVIILNFENISSYYIVSIYTLQINFFLVSYIKDKEPILLPRLSIRNTINFYYFIQIV